MTITQLIQNSPAKANDLFAKLADTSEGAVKTREKLFSELKQELELLTGLEEQHLFPVLRKHKETKDLVNDAVNDNKQVRSLLAELDQMPKNDQGFAGKLTELRKIFQQHVRDEKKELLPAVRKALSDEQAQEIADKIEAEKVEANEARRQEAEQRRAEARREREEAERRQAEAEEAKRKEAEQRRAEARREREEAERRQVEAEEAKRKEAEQRRAEAQREREEKERREAEAQAAERRTREAALAASRTVEGAAHTSLRVIEAGGTAARAGSEVATETARQSIGAASHAMQSAAQPMMRPLENMANLPGVAASTANDLNRVWAEWLGRTAENGARASQSLMGLRSPQQIVEVQGRFFQEAWSAWMDASRKMVQISVRASEDMMQSMARQGGQDRGGRR